MKMLEMSAKTVEDAVQAACDALGVDRDDINVSYEVLEFPARRLFKTIPAKVRVTVAEPEVEEKPVVEEPVAKVEEKTEEVQKTEEESAAVEETADENAELEIAADPRLQTAVDYLTPIFKLMGVENFAFTAFKKGEATVLHVTGEHMGALIGRRGETMESLSYLASLVVNRMEGPYMKLGLDVGGYRDKREEDLAALTARIAERVKRTGCYYEMEAMNPYERHIIHTAAAKIEGVRSESKGEGTNRHVVLYSTDPNASNLPDREGGRKFRGDRRGSRGGKRDGRGGRGGRSGRGDRPRREGGRGYGAQRSSVPGRDFADLPRDPEAKPIAPTVTEHIHDGDEFSFGKIDF